MSSDERLRHKGLLAEKEQRAKVLALKIQDLRERLRMLSDPHRPHRPDDTSRMRVALDELVDAEVEWERVLRDIQALRDDLGLSPMEVR